jgi:hypothetical protein
MARPWSAHCYGVARQREGSRQNSIGCCALTFSTNLNACARFILTLNPAEGAQLQINRDWGRRADRSPFGALASSGLFEIHFIFGHQFLQSVTAPRQKPGRGVSR